MRTEREIRSTLAWVEAQEPDKVGTIEESEFAVALRWVLEPPAGDQVESEAKAWQICTLLPVAVLTLVFMAGTVFTVVLVVLKLLRVVS